jgi:glycosyltransferase involved in cell wall biosynthesis
VRVLYLIDSLSAGGAEQALVSMAQPLSSRGVSLEIGYLYERPGLHRELEELGVSLFCLDGSSGRIGRLQRARRLLLEHRSDLVHTTLLEADIIGRVAGLVTRTPVVTSLVNVRHAESEVHNPQLAVWKTGTMHALDTVTARIVVRFHALTNYVADTMARRLAIPRDRIDVIPRGRDPASLGTRTTDRRTRVRANLGVRPGTPLLLAVGRQERQKGLDVLLEAFSRVRHIKPDARLLIAGRDGSETPHLRRIAARLELGPTVQFLGTRSDIPDLLCAADMFVFPSRWEGLGSVLLEAMALETPIVASDLPPVREILMDGSASLVGPSDAPSLAVAILQTLADDTEATTRANLARTHFLETFTIDGVADRMVAFYDRAIRSGSGSSRLRRSP